MAAVVLSSLIYFAPSAKDVSLIVRINFPSSDPHMAAILPSNRMYYIPGRSFGNWVVDASDQESTQASNQQMSVLLGPVAILWDIENCPVPGEVRPEDVAGNIRMALRVHPVVRGAVTMFSAYGDFNIFPRRLREGCQRTGVNLIDVPNGKKDAADKAILVDMFLFALDNPPPSTVLLISGDVDFAPALHKLGQRGYTVVLAIPAGVGVSSALCNAGQFVWDWPSVARGEGLVPAKAFLCRAPDVGGYLVRCLSSDDSDFQNEEESVVHRGISQSEYGMGTNPNQIYCLNSKHMSLDFTRTSNMVGENNPESLRRNANNVVSRHASSHVAAPVSSIQTSRSVPSSLMQKIPTANVSSSVLSRPIQTSLPTNSGHYAITSNETNAGPNSAPWVEPGDIQGLKRQLVKLINICGGCLLLARVPSEYHKVFGRPLYLAQYGSCKLVNLIKKMHDALSIEGNGNKKFLCLREPVNVLNKFRQSRATNNTSAKDSTDMVTREEYVEKGKGVQEFSRPDARDNEINEDVDAYSMEVNLACYSDEGSDYERVNEQEEEYSNGEAILQEDVNGEEAAEARLEVFKQELQELLVSHACKILLTSFLTLYQQKYARDLDYSLFGVKELEALIEKVRDIAIMKEEQGTKRKFLVANIAHKR